MNKKEIAPDEKIGHQVSEWRLRGCLAAFAVGIGYLLLPGGIYDYAAMGLLGFAFWTVIMTGGGYGIREVNFSIKPHPKIGGFATGAFFVGCCMTIAILLMSALSKR